MNGSPKIEAAVGCEWEVNKERRKRGKETHALFSLFFCSLHFFVLSFLSFSLASFVLPFLFITN